MCSVQVVLYAEVMGRSSERRPSRGGVCRRLFADAPSEKAAADPGHFLRAMEAELRRRDVERWNFDFERERPLPGRFQWVAVGPQKGAAPAEELKTEEVVIVDEVVRPQKAPSSIPECERKRKSGGAGAPATQAKITDFLRKRKRVEAEDSNTLKMRRLNANLATTARPT